MITWVQELTMMHQAIHPPQWHTVPMEQGPYMKFVLLSKKKKKLLSYDDVTEIALHYLWATHRLFSCGTNKEGESFLVEWNESEGAVKRTYHGLGKRTVGIVQFDTTRNRFLAAGDDFLVKFWDMDNTQLLATSDVENSLPVIMVMLGLVLISL